MSRPDLTGRFYRDILQLPLHGKSVRIGWSTLECVQAQQPVGSVHLAFNVAPSRFDAAAHWIGTRSALLAAQYGRQRFQLGGVWQSQSVYFDGPDGAVLELIARQALQHQVTGQGNFHGEALLCLSEIGLPSNTVGVVTSSVAHHFGARRAGQRGRTATGAAPARCTGLGIAGGVIAHAARLMRPRAPAAGRTHVRQRYCWLRSAQPLHRDRAPVLPGDATGTSARCGGPWASA